MSDYMSHETVTISLDRYEQMKSDAEGSHRRMHLGEIAKNKLHELGYEVKYYDNFDPEYVLSIPPTAPPQTE